MDRILPILLATITGHNRQKVIPGIDFEWSENCWTHNLFRAYELVFWRREGIRIEARTQATQNDDGTTTILREFYTLESALCYVETLIRSPLSFPRIFKFRLVVPTLSTPFGPVFASPFLFAIAFDTETEVDNVVCNTTVTYSHTTSGSNTIMFTPVVDDTSNALDKISGITYNAVSETRIATEINGGVPPAEPLFLYMLVAPTTGANNVIVTSSANIHISSSTCTYSGAKQTSQPDATAVNYAAGTSVTSTTNVVAANCWVIAAGADGATGSPIASTGINAVRTTMTFECVTGDSNGTVSTGNYATTFTHAAGGVLSVVSASFSPVAGAVTVTPLRMLRGVGI